MTRTRLALVALLVVLVLVGAWALFRQLSRPVIAGIEMRSYTFPQDSARWLEDHKHYEQTTLVGQWRDPKYDSITAADSLKALSDTTSSH